jgi:hypothetical protein
MKNRTLIVMAIEIGMVQIQQVVVRYIKCVIVYNQTSKSLL